MDMAEYNSVTWDVGRARPVYCNRDGQLAYTGKSGVQIRVPFAPDKMAIVGYHDKANTVLVDPVQVTEAKLVGTFNNSHKM